MDWNGVSVKTVFFDLDETLIEHTRTGPELLHHVYTSRNDVLPGVDELRFGKVLWEHANALWRRMFDPGVTGEAALVEMFRLTLRDLNRDPSQAESMRDAFMQAVLSSTRPSPGAKETVARLHADNVATGIITNGYAYLQLAKIRHHGYEDLFETIVVSETAGAHKPAQRIFGLALAQTGAAPKDAWHVGDNVENDIAGAERAGLTSVLYDPEGTRAPDPEHPDVDVYPSHIIAAWDELPGLVRESAGPVPRSG